MKGRVIAHGQVGGRDAVALIEDGQLDDLLVDPPEAELRVGAVLWAVAGRPMKGLGGQFVQLPRGQGYLRGGQVPPGQGLHVQVTGFAEPGKAVPVSTKLAFRGRFVVLTPGAPGVNVSRQIADQSRRDELAAVMAQVPTVTGAIVRSAAADAEDHDILSEAQDLARQAEAVAVQADAPTLLYAGPGAAQSAWVEWPNAQAAQFEEFEVADMIDALRDPLVDLGVGSAFIEPTRAFVAIDVNTGGDTSPAAGLKANIALARALPRQLRCRGLGGQIVVDFAPFQKKDRRVLETALRAAFKSDPVATNLVGWTPLGHFELNRKRARLPLV